MYMYVYMYMCLFDIHVYLMHNTTWTLNEMYIVHVSVHVRTCMYCVCDSTGLPEQGEGLGAGLDSCVLPTRHEGLSIVQTTDLYPP